MLLEINGEISPEKNEGTEPKQKHHPVVDGTGDRSKVRCYKEQYCIGTWNVRPPKDEAMTDCFRKTRSYFQCRRGTDLMTLRLKDTEADDIAAFIAKTYGGKAEIYLYSMDHDWFQLLDEGICQIRPDVKSGRDLVYSRKTASELLGYDVKKWPLVAAFKGDPSDNVPSVGIREDTALKWLSKYAWSLPSVFANEKTAKAKEAQIWRNYKLVKLDGSPCSFADKDLDLLDEFMLD